MANLTLGTSAANTPTLSAVNGTATALSTDVASHFGKRHDDVLKAIGNLLQELPADRLGNFAETVAERPNPAGGAPIQSRAYRLTRDGFTLLAMGFTGKKALAFKLAYLDAFNRMEAELEGQRTAAAAHTPSLRHRRWLLAFDHNGREVVQAIDHDHCLLKYDDLPRLLAARDNWVPSPLLASIASACLQRLAARCNAQTASPSTTPRSAA